MKPQVLAPARYSSSLSALLRTSRGLGLVLPRACCTRLERILGCRRSAIAASALTWLGRAASTYIPRRSERSGAS